MGTRSEKERWSRGGNDEDESGEEEQRQHWGWKEREIGRSLNGDRSHEVPTELLAVVRRFRESNLSCDHLRECLNELLGVGPTTSLRELLSARHLVWECGPNRNKRRTETRAGTRGATSPGPVGMGLESTYLPVGLLLNPRSRLMDSSSPGPDVYATYLRHALTTTCPRVDVSRNRLSFFPILLFLAPPGR